MPQTVTIENVGQAFAMVKEMQAEGLSWSEDYRPLGRMALARLLEERMAMEAERRLERMAELGEADRRNGSYARHLLTALGDIELCVLRARAAARRCADRWGPTYPKTVACLRNDLDDLLTCWRYPTLAERRRVRTTNAIERHFREVRRRTRPMGVFSDRTSMDRILFAVFAHENRNQSVSPPFLLTQNN